MHTCWIFFSKLILYYVILVDNVKSKMCDLVLPRILRNQTCAIQKEGVSTSCQVYVSGDQVVTMRFGRVNSMAIIL